MTHSEAFKDLLKRKGFTQKTMADRIGLKRTEFNNKANNFMRFEFGELLTMAAVFQMSIHTLIRHVRTGQGRSDKMEDVKTTTTVEELESKLNIVEQEQRRIRARKDAYETAYRKAHKQLGKDIRSGEINKEGYKSPLKKLKEDYPEFQ